MQEHRYVSASKPGSAALRSLSATFLVFGAIACGSGESPSDMGEERTTEYVLACGRLTAFTCPTDIACATEGAEPRITVSGKRLTLADEEGNRGSTRISANGDVRVVLADGDAATDCTVSRTFAFTLSPLDENGRLPMTVSFKHHGNCPDLEECTAELTVQLQTIGVPAPPCPEAYTGPPCGPVILDNP